MPSHHIAGCEALDDHKRRLVHFSHAHGSIQMLRRRRRGGLVALAAFLAGLAVPLVLALLLAKTGA